MAIAFQVDSVFAAKKKSGNQNQSKTTSKNKNQNNQSSKKKSNDKKSKKKDNDNKKNNKKSKKKNNDEDYNDDDDNDNDNDRDNDRDNDNKKSNKKSNKKEPSLSELKKCRCVKRYIELTEGGDDEDDEEEEKPKGKKLKSKKTREKDENESASSEDDDEEDNEDTKQSKSKKNKKDKKKKSKKSKKSNDDWKNEAKLTPPDIGEKQLGPVKIGSKPAFELAQKTLDSSIVKYQDAPQLNTQHIDIDTAGIKLAENSSSTNEIPDTKINTNSEKSLFKEEKPAAHKYKYRIDQKEAIKFRQDLEKYRQAYA